MKIENISGFLKENDVKPSLQRIKIFDYLVTHKNHPTVDMIYKDLIPEIPTLSKTTVYNTLHLFIKHKIAIILNIEDNETRFDANIMLHGHFKCKKCGEILDFNIDENKLKYEDLKNVIIEEKHLYFKGFCSSCKDDNK